jgi:hypothetical protein
MVPKYALHQTNCSNVELLEKILHIKKDGLWQTRLYVKWSNLGYEPL